LKNRTPDLPGLPNAVAIDDLLRLADQCVKCGLCLPHCPTFAHARNEADSPRGRIALIQGWATGDLAMTPILAGHLDGCLGCRNCERACPSGVAYGQIADTAKALRVAALPGWRRRLASTGLHALSSPRLVAMTAWMTRLYRWLGLAQLVEIARLDQIRALYPYHRLAVAMGSAARPVVSQDPAGADLDLFIGCMGAAAQGGGVEATRQVLACLGLRVRILSPSGCCGAMLRHNGYPAEADAQHEACARIHGNRPVVGLASACVAELRDHPALRRVEELCAFLDGADWPESIQMRPIHRRVLVHEPCTHRNQLGGNAAVHRLLARIPGLTAAPLPAGQGCCGAAGTHLLQQPDMARALLTDLIAPLRRDHPDLIVTTNPGCALHLAAGIREAGLDIQVRHPVELIAEALVRPDQILDTE
jgi:glycolate oxidase iron-sulfur subunit